MEYPDARDRWEAARQNLRTASDHLRYARQFLPPEHIAFREECVKVALDRLWAAQAYANVKRLLP